jgi:predicted nucleic acid-binding protein
VDVAAIARTLFVQGELQRVVRASTTFSVKPRPVVYRGQRLEITGRLRGASGTRQGDVARAWGGFAARVRRAGAQPRTRNADLLIAATAQVHGAALLTHNVADFRHVADVVRVLHPADVG